MDFSYFIEKLRKAGIEFEEGLNNVEIETIQSKYHFVFPPDLKDFLQCALPVSNGFWNWRGEDQSKLEDILNWPFEGIYFDIEQNNFWMDNWGLKPKALKDQLEIAKHHIKNAPTLIPICGHRFLPSEPPEPGNPVYSVYQTDIIFYGRNFREYLQNEFSNAFDYIKYESDTEIKEILFWSELAG